MRQPDQYPDYPDTVGRTATVASLPALPSPRALVARRALVGAGFLGVAGDALLRNEPWGVGLLAWMAAFAAVAIALARRAERPLSGEGRAWLAVALLFAGGLAWRDADLLQFFDVLAMLTALVLLAMSINDVPVRGLAAARVRDLLRAATGTGLSVATGSVPLLLTDTEPHTAISASAPGTARRIARAVLITLPIVLLFSVLLAQADPFFGSFIRLPDLDLDVIISHVLITGFFAWVVAGWLRRTLLGTPATAAPAAPLPFALGITDLTLALGALNLLFAAFVAAQLGWLFGGEALVLRTTGLSYAEYARRGFFELTWVAGLVLPVLLGAHALIPVSDQRAHRSFRRLSIALLVLLGAIMLSAAARMRLYIHYYGISTDRLYASAFMAWLAMVFVWLAATVLRNRPRRFAAGLVASGMAVLLALNILNPDAFVARQNLARGDPVGSRGGADLRYVAGLGGDAVPLVVAALASPDASLATAPEQERCAAARTLLERWTGDRLARVSGHWTQWNLARQHAAAAVAEQEPAIRQLACAQPEASQGMKER